MTISIHFHSVNRHFNVYSSDGTIKRNSTSNGGGLVHHIERDASDAQSAKQATRSMLKTDLTQYNVQLIDKNVAEKNLKRAQSLIDERYKFLHEHQNSDEEYKLQLKSLQKEKDALRKKLSRYKKKGYEQSKLDAVDADLTAVKSRLDALKKNGKPDKTKYDNWSDDISVAYTGTIQLSNDALAQNGWQFTDSNGQLLDPSDVDDESKAYSYDEQKHYEESHSDCHGIRDVTSAYKFAFRGGINKHQDHYGAPIASSIHFDESTPHVDYMALTIGQSLNGKWFDHVGDKDNDTKGVKENIRTRTFINGRNGDQNKEWTSKIQDRFAEDIRTGALQLGGYHNGKFVTNAEKGKTLKYFNDKFTKDGLSRGVKVDERTRKNRDKLKNAKHKADVISKMMNDAENYQAETHEEVNMMLIDARSSASATINDAQSDADKTTSSANNYLSSASNINSIAIQNSIQDSIANESAYNSLELSLKSSYAQSASIAQSSFESSYNDALSVAVKSNQNSANKHVSSAISSINDSLTSTNSDAYSQAIYSGYSDGYDNGYQDGINNLDDSVASFESSQARTKQSLRARELTANTNDEMINGVFSAVAPSIDSTSRSAFIKNNRINFTNGSAMTVGEFINQKLDSMATSILKSSPTDFRKATELQNVTSSVANKRNRTQRADSSGPSF